jgi:hypothetical protein
MFTLVYVSSAVTPFSQDQLAELLAQSRANNESLGISGMLLYKDGNFMQVLEGDERQVLALSAKIAKDPRHRGVMVLLKEHQPQRAFAEWSMAFRDLNADDSQRVPGFNEFMNANLTDRAFADDPSRAQRLLLTFRRSM